MKREINCDDCAASWRRHAGVKPGDDPFAVAERMSVGMKQVRGKLLCGATCDGCGAELARGSEAIATSIYTATRPYFEWESDYLEVRR